MTKMSYTYCIICQGSGLTVDTVGALEGGNKKTTSFVRKKKGILSSEQVNCGACNGTGRQLEDSYLDNMMVYYSSVANGIRSSARMREMHIMDMELDMEEEYSMSTNRYDDDDYTYMTRDTFQREIDLSDHRGRRRRSMMGSITSSRNNDGYLASSSINSRPHGIRTRMPPARQRHGKQVNEMQRRRTSSHVNTENTNGVEKDRRKFWRDSVMEARTRRFTMDL